jgi:hypothetical protein
MKIIALTTAAVFAASTAFAGTLAPMVMDEKPMVEDVMMEDEAAGSGALGWIIPVIAIVAIAVAADD